MFTAMLTFAAVIGICIVGSILHLLQDPILYQIAATIIVAWLLAKAYNIIFLGGH